LAAEVPEHRLRLLGIAAQAHEIASDLHCVVHDLHPSRLRTLGLVECLRLLCQEVERQGSMSVSFGDAGMPQPLDPDVALCLYRVAQEALHNVSRHSRAHQAAVTLTRQGSDAYLQIADTGVGFDQAAPQHGGLGLLNMHERVAALGGRLTVSTCPGGGTQVKACVPMPAPQSPSISSGSVQDPLVGRGKVFRPARWRERRTAVRG
jgi:signal transduction histidine kinase